MVGNDEARNVSFYDPTLPFSVRIACRRGIRPKVAKQDCRHVAVGQSLDASHGHSNVVPTWVRLGFSSMSLHFDESRTGGSR